MCGIVGVASTEGMKNRSSRLQFIKMGLDINSWRGWESTGLAMVPQASLDSPIIYKRALNGRDFIQLHQVDKYLNDIEKYSVVLGHNRAATTGRGNIVDHNAHPFQYGRITLVHNGHIRNTHDLKGALQGAQCQVDSAQVAFSMNANGEKETLEQIEGGFAFVWWNAETGILNIARNTERPLHMAFAAKENTFYWASELTQLLHLLRDTEIDEELGILFPAPWNWYKFNLKDLREYEKVPFVKSQGRRKENGRTFGHNNENTINNSTQWTDGEWEEWERNFKTDSTTTDPTTPESATSEVDEIRQTIATQRPKDAKLSGVPTSKKRIARAKMLLRGMGIDYGSTRLCTPITWCKYRNQQNLGTVVARIKRTGHLIEVLSVREPDWIEYQKAGQILVDCINVRNGPNNTSHVVGTISPRMEDYLEKFKARNSKLKSEVTTPQEVAKSIERNWCGPNSQMISLERFFELTARGCAYCSGDINAIDHKEVVWVGREDSPLCPICASDPEVLDTIGLSNVGKQGNIH